MKNCIFGILAVVLAATACNRDKTITEEAKPAPVIELDSETGVYTVKVGRELTIAPSYKHVEEAVYTWTAGGKRLSDQPVLRYTWEQEQELYVTLRVETPAGKAEEELKVEVVALAPPVISLVMPERGLKVLRGTEYVFTPDIRNDDSEGFGIEWIRDGKMVCAEKKYAFREERTGLYTITARAYNDDGESVREFDVEVVDEMPRGVRFPTPSRGQTSTDRHTFAGRPVYLRPQLENFENPQYSWSVDGQTVSGADGRVFRFTPEAAGEYAVTVTVTEGAAGGQQLSQSVTRAGESVTAEVKVICEAKSEQERYRKATAASTVLCSRVYEYVPAPGQFINDPKSGFDGKVNSEKAAAEYAAARIAERKYVSLGAFGGYIIVGFDHSIAPGGGEYDFAIEGNALDKANEPGVVWVMQDTNGNGQPDDEWYELKGSETGAEGTRQDYEVTYYRPAYPTHTPWTDCGGGTGRVDVNPYHVQDYYYPQWIAEESYTLAGTLLSPRNSRDEATGDWTNAPYGWGYADNIGSDSMAAGDEEDGSGQRTGFRIANAIHRDGTPVGLMYIDFIKVQCGVLAQSGRLGEISTEVASFEDLSLAGRR